MNVVRPFSAFFLKATHPTFPRNMSMVSARVSCIIVSHEHFLFDQKLSGSVFWMTAGSVLIVSRDIGMLLNE